ncbi:hypothetical protein FRB96_005691 [Tulasnella sp. 330]|nr:hypothetical protein FRB96_005691 [Tulasnella sp. 330]
MSSAAPATPSRSTAAATARADLLTHSPHYSTTRRHSLYGTEDRIVIDPGSRVWKVGFSGEGRPRDVFAVKEWAPGSMTGKNAIETAELESVLEAELQDRMRDVFFKSLLADPKARKVIIVEHPLLPLATKDMFARILFQNLEASVPSLAFAPSHVLALLAVGRVTGLVLDCGHFESTLLPIYSARPLFINVRTTPLAGARLTSQLRALLLLFGSYQPPPTIIRAAAPPPTRTRIPGSILTDTLLEHIKTKCLFVGMPISDTLGLDDGMDLDPPEVANIGSPTESGRESRTSMSSASEIASASESLSQASVSIRSSSAIPESQLRARAALYKRHSTATDVRMRVVPPAAHATASGSGAAARGTLIIPGWVRERAAELFFESGDVDEPSVVEVLLDALLKVPVDLRRTLASTILVVGGTAMLPGFIPRLQAELEKRLATAPLSHTLLSSALSGRSTPTQTTSGVSTPSDPATTPTAVRSFRQQQQQVAPAVTRRPRYDPYSQLRTLAAHIAILNNPSPSHTDETSVQARANAGKAPAFAPALMSWVGGSLAGALKIGSEEIVRERWDEAYEQDHEEQMQELTVMAEAAAAAAASSAAESDQLLSSPTKSPSKKHQQLASPAIQAIGASVAYDGGGMHPPAFTYLPDWTRTPLGFGAPNVNWIRPEAEALIAPSEMTKS